jgi:hypothetical protein
VDHGERLCRIGSPLKIAAEVGGVAEDRAGEDGLAAEGRSAKAGVAAEGRASEVGGVAEGRAVKRGAGKYEVISEEGLKLGVI